MAKEYNGDSIKVIDADKDRVQSNPGLYIPDKRLAGCIHLIREIKDNADDEAMLQVDTEDGVVSVSYDERTREIVVKDRGRGIPQEKLKDVCEKLHSSGKFSKGDNSAYKYSSGLNGVGLKITNFLSEKFDITSAQNGKSVTRMYEDGDFKKEKKESVDSKTHGTTCKFIISDKYMKDTGKIKCKHVQQMIEEKADACPGLVTKFTGYDKDGEKISKKYVGLDTEDLIKKYNKPTSKIWTFDFETKDDYGLKCRLGFSYDAKATDGGNLMGWTNYIYNKDGGTHVDAIVDTMYNVFSKYMKKDYFSDKDKKNLQIKKEDIVLGLCASIVILTVKVEFHGQYKEKVISPEIGDLVAENFKKKLSKLPDSDMKTIAGIIKNNIKARMSSQRARAQVKKVGNGLSKDKIDKYYPAKMKCDTDYRELYITEGLSAGAQTEKSRYDFQEVYMLRGKVDNIYDHSIAELAKIDIVDDLSRIIGLVPGKTGHINQNAIKVLSDADADGLAIRAGVALIFAVAFPQVIQEGRLYIVEPPLFGFTENGKSIFKSTNRDYLTYLQNKFAKKNDLYLNNHKMSDTSITEFLLKNERYVEFLKSCASSNVCSPYFTELVISHLQEYGIEKGSVKKWDKLVKNNFSPQLEAEWVDDHIIISGIKDERYEMIDVDEKLLNSKKTKRLIDLMNLNLGNIYGYKIDGEINKEDMSMYQVLKTFNKYKADKLVRFKGLGTMEAEDLRDTCMNLKRQRCTQITFSDVDTSIRLLANWHSKKEKYRDYRRNFMMSYEPDLKEIST